LKKLIPEIPDFPKKGILFYDITTLLKDKLGLATLIDALAEYYLPKKVDLILGMEARGFIFGPALAYRLNAGFVPVRKPGKLPAPTARVEYELEYGTNILEIHKDAVQKGQRVIIVDDLLATGHRERVVEHTGIREIAHGKAVQPLQRAGKSLALVFVLHANFPGKHTEI